MLRKKEAQNNTWHHTIKLKADLDEKKNEKEEEFPRMKFNLKRERITGGDEKVKESDMVV